MCAEVEEEISGILCRCVLIHTSACRDCGEPAYVLVRRVQDDDCTAIQGVDCYVGSGVTTGEAGGFVGAFRSGARSGDDGRFEHSGGALRRQRGEGSAIGVGAPPGWWWARSVTS